MEADKKDDPNPSASKQNLSGNANDLPLVSTEGTPSFSFFGNGEFKPPPGRVVGVYFDKQRRIWRANWREGEVGKRKTKNFSVEDYGFDEARRLAIEYRLMKITEIAQMELNCNDIDRLRLSSCRAPAQGGDRRRPNTTDPNTHRSRSLENLGEPYAYSGIVPPPSGDFGDASGIDPRLFNWNNGMDPRMFQGAGEMYSGGGQGEVPPNWYYNPDILFNLYQQHHPQALEQMMNNPPGNFGPPPKLEPDDDEP